MGRAYGLPIDDQYVQFRAMRMPEDSSVIRKMIQSKFNLTGE